MDGTPSHDWPLHPLGAGDQTYSPSKQDIERLKKLNAEYSVANPPWDEIGKQLQRVGFQAEELSRATAERLLNSAICFFSNEPISAAVVGLLSPGLKQFGPTEAFASDAPMRIEGDVVVARNPAGGSIQFSHTKVFPDTNSPIDDLRDAIQDILFGVSRPDLLDRATAARTLRRCTHEAHQLRPDIVSSEDAKQIEWTLHELEKALVAADKSKIGDSIEWLRDCQERLRLAIRYPITTSQPPSKESKKEDIKAGATFVKMYWEKLSPEERAEIKRRQQSNTADLVEQENGRRPALEDASTAFCKMLLDRKDAAFRELQTLGFDIPDDTLEACDYLGAILGKDISEMTLRQLVDEARAWAQRELVKERIRLRAQKEIAAGTPQPKSGQIRIVCCYSRIDEALRNNLEVHLSSLKRSGDVSTWHDRKIDPGKEWKREIDVHLDSADIILLLISADFIGSDYCYDVEMRRALQRHHAGEATVIPVIVRSCDWKHTEMGNLQALPKDGVPVVDWGSLDHAFTDIALGIRKVVTGLRPKATPPDINP